MKIGNASSGVGVRSVEFW